MSDIKDKTNEYINKIAELDAIKQETAHKKIILDQKRINNQFDQMTQNEKDNELAKLIDFGALSVNEVEKIQKENEEYMAAAKTPMMFINEIFSNVVPFFRKNFILIGAKTGQGKSTTVANIVYGLLTAVNPANGKTRRTLVLTNEQATPDFYNMITCCVNGWPYTNHSRFTNEQVKEFNRMIPILSSCGRLTVIDNSYSGIHGMTTSLEGIQRIFDNLITQKEYYDAIVIDYYQNIIHSTSNPQWSANEVSEELARMIDNFKNIYPAPIVMVAQMKPTKEGDLSPFQERIQGRKVIMNPATLVMEMVADPKNLRTKWVVHKSRFTEAIGKDFWTGYDNGRFVKYDTNFIQKAERRALDRAARIMNTEITKDKKEEKV